MLREGSISTTKESGRNRINAQIRIPLDKEIRLIGPEGDQMGVLRFKEAKDEAIKLGLDLVEISPNASPPVLRIMDYGKFKYQEDKQSKKKQKVIKLKEIKFRPNTDKGDYEVKLRNLRSFLEEGNKVKITVFFRGREITHQELGMKLLERVRDDLVEQGKVDFFPKLEGRQLVMILSPKKK